MGNDICCAGRPITQHNSANKTLPLKAASVLTINTTNANGGMVVPPQEKNLQQQISNINDKQSSPTSLMESSMKKSMTGSNSKAKAIKVNGQNMPKSEGQVAYLNKLINIHGASSNPQQGQASSKLLLACQDDDLSVVLSYLTDYTPLINKVAAMAASLISQTLSCKAAPENNMIAMDGLISEVIVIPSLHHVFDEVMTKSQGVNKLVKNIIEAPSFAIQHDLHIKSDVDDDDNKLKDDLIIKSLFALNYILKNKVCFDECEPYQFIANIVPLISKSKTRSIQIRGNIISCIRLWTRHKPLGCAQIINNCDLIKHLKDLFEDIEKADSGSKNVSTVCNIIFCLSEMSSQHALVSDANHDIEISELATNMHIIEAYSKQLMEPLLDQAENYLIQSCTQNKNSASQRSIQVVLKVLSFLRQRLINLKKQRSDQCDYDYGNGFDQDNEEQKEEKSIKQVQNSETNFGFMNQLSLINKQDNNDITSINQLQQPPLILQQQTKQHYDGKNLINNTSKQPNQKQILI